MSDPGRYFAKEGKCAPETLFGEAEGNLVIVRGGSVESSPTIIGVGLTALHWTPAPHALGAEGNRYEGVFFDAMRLINRFRTPTSEGVVSVPWDQIVHWDVDDRGVLRIQMIDETNLQFSPHRSLRLIDEFARHQLDRGGSR